ncbi:hypothetical protein OSTOST_19680 [Ostertagia ostertagi]
MDERSRFLADAAAQRRERELGRVQAEVAVKLQALARGYLSRQRFVNDIRLKYWSKNRAHDSQIKCLSKDGVNRKELTGWHSDICAIMSSHYIVIGLVSKRYELGYIVPEQVYDSCGCEKLF